MTLNIEGYEQLSSIYDGENSQVYRAIRKKDRLWVILKFLKANYPTLEQIKRYKQEYNLAHQLSLKNIIKAYGLEKWNRQFIIIFEDFGAISMKEWLTQNQGKITIDVLLSLAIKITKALGQIHRENVIHNVY